jgi:hypothetical protein
LTAAFIDPSFIPQERVFGIPKRRLARVVEHIRNNLDKPPAVSALSKNGLQDLEVGDCVTSDRCSFTTLFRAGTDCSGCIFCDWICPVAGNQVA